MTNSVLFHSIRPDSGTVVLVALHNNHLLFYAHTEEDEEGRIIAPEFDVAGAKAIRDALNERIALLEAQSNG